MEPKHDLLVFNKKEVGIILILLALVSLFSFTLGLRMGKKLSGDKTDVSHKEEPSLTTDTVGHDEHEEAKHEVSAHGEAVHAEPKHEDHVADTHGDAASGVASEKITEKAASERLHEELETEKVKSGKKIPMTLPSEKKAAKAETSLSKVIAGKYTLQVGSHRTLQEAKDQVALLKDKGFDAFSMEVVIPEKGTWYRVGIGVYSSRELAEKSAAQLKGSKPLPSYIVQKVAE